MKKILIVTFLFCALFLKYTPAQAQENQPVEIVSVNEPISAELRQALMTWLETERPSSAVYYAVTYTQPIGFDTYASLVGLNIATPDAFWSLVGDEEGNQQVIWLDTVLVKEDGTISYPFHEMSVAPFAKFADIAPLPQLGAGGGAYVRFPWEPAKAVQYGILGVHNASYGTDGTWGAVDLVSGTDMGSGAADDRVFASVSGTVSYVCDYEDTVAVKLTGNGDSFLYAHLLPNANLVMGHTFSAGQYMGALKHGSFVDECGNAVQQADHYHLHWGFITSGTAPRIFKAEGCIMTKSAAMTSGVWDCGNTNIKALGYLYHYGNIGINPDTGEVGYGQGAGGGPSFWAYFVGGMGDVFSTLFTDNLPEHNSNVPFLTPILNGVKIALRIGLILLRGNFNFLPAVTAIIFVLTFKLSMGGVFGVIGIARMIKA